jgi:hypothetical protein
LSGRNSKYDRSLFQRLEEAGHEVHLLNVQYRMHPTISEFPRRIFYDGQLFDGDNVKHPEYGNPLKREVFRKFPAFQVSKSWIEAAGYLFFIHCLSSRKSLLRQSIAIHYLGFGFCRGARWNESIEYRRSAIGASPL